MSIIISLLMSTIIATFMMTLFSYIVSETFRKLYKEPLLLKYLLIQLNISISDHLMEILAWLIHYAIGLLFILSYYFLWHYEFIHLTFFSGLYLGAISGVIGIISWIIMFRLSKLNRKANDKGYYIQLFFAHVIFGIVAIQSFLYLHYKL